MDYFSIGQGKAMPGMSGLSGFNGLTASDLATLGGSDDQNIAELLKKLQERQQGQGMMNLANMLLQMGGPQSMGASSPSLLDMIGRIK